MLAMVKIREKRIAEFASQKLWKSIFPSYDQRREKRKHWLSFWALLFLILSWARPQWGIKSEDSLAMGFDLVIAVDVSRSMDVEDIAPSRLGYVKKQLKKIVDALSGDRVALVAFAGSSYVVSPLTSDQGYLSTMIELLEPGMIKNQGTAIAVALKTSGELLLEEKDGSDAKKSATKIVLLVTDGEDHEKDAAKMAGELSARGIEVYFLGVGTDSGGPVPLKNEQGQTVGYKKSRTGETVISKLNVSAIKEIAAGASGKFAVLSPQGNEIANLLQDFGKLDRSGSHIKRRIVKEDRYQIFLAIALLFLILELSYSRTSPQVLSSLALIFLIPGWASTEAQATEVDAYKNNKEGIEAYKSGDFDRAKQKFAEAQAHSPKKPEFQFNRSVSELSKGENLDGVAQAFEDLSREAKSNRNSDLESRAQYNLGHAKMQAKKTDEAVKAYLEAIRASSEKSEVGDLARYNLKMMLTQNQNQQGQGEKQQEKQEDSKGDPKDKKNEGQAKGFKDHEKQTKFESQKLSKEAAEKILREIEEKEKELKRNFGNRENQKGAEGYNEKDW